MVICDINDEESLLQMAKSAKVVINCCGPFQFIGEAVVKACIDAGTHHVDVSGEPQFMEKLQLEQDQKAKEKGKLKLILNLFDDSVFTFEKHLIYFFIIE